MASTAPRSTRAIEREIAAIQRELEEVAEETADNKISVVRVDGLVNDLDKEESKNDH